MGRSHSFFGLSFLSVKLGLKSPPVLTSRTWRSWASSPNPLCPNRDSMSGLQPDLWRTQDRPPSGQHAGALTRWKASWECWKVRSIYLRTDKAAPRTMGYRSLEKTWKKASGQESPRPGPPKAKGSHRPERGPEMLELKQQTHVGVRTQRCS